MKGKRIGIAKFPVARIKKIMQVDDDVGKVASSSPVIISKALELFLEDILIESSEITRNSGGKKLMPYHLKRLFETNPQYDFLIDLVEGIKDPTAGLSGSTAGPSSSSKLSKSKATPPHPSKTGGKGKAKAEDDDFSSGSVGVPMKEEKVASNGMNGKDESDVNSVTGAGFASMSDVDGGPLAGGGLAKKEQYSFDGGRYSDDDDDEDPDDDEDEDED